MENQDELTIIANGLPYVLSPKKNMIWEEGMEGNYISFDWVQTDSHGNYHVNVQARGQLRVHSIWNNEEVGEIVIIPKTLMDKGIYDDLEKVKFNEQSIASGWNLVIVDEAIERRWKTGRLPELEIGNDSFFVDLRLKELRHVNDFTCKLEMNHFDLIGNRRYACYHTERREIVELVYTEKGPPPEHVVCIELPDFKFLDPVALARMRGLKDTAFLSSIPMVRNPKAVIYPLQSIMVPQSVMEGQKINAQNKRKRTGRKMPK